MLIQSWSNVVRNWLSPVTRTKKSSAKAIRRQVRSRGNVQIEGLEERCLLSAISISDVTVVEGNAGQTNATFTITLIRDTAGVITVQADTADGTATQPADYIAQSALLTFPDAPFGPQIITGSVLVNGDLVDELDETFVVNLTAPVGATLTDAQGVATITDDDATPAGAPSVTLSIAPATLAEAAGTTTVTATLSATSLLPVTVALNYTGTATDLVDYTGALPVIVIPAGSLTGTLVLTAVQDVLDEVDETIIVDVAAVANGTETGTQQVTATITDDDVTPVGAPTVTLSIAPATLAEAAGTSTLTATLSAVSLLPVTVALTYAGTATTLVDYTGAAPVIVIPAGSLTGTLVLTAVQDVIDELDETIIVDVATVANGTETGTQTVTATITDDDVTPVGSPTVTLSIAPATLAEAAGTTTLTATLSAVSLLPVTVALTYTGTATDLVDYTGSMPAIVIPAGSLTGTLVLTAVQDVLDEVDETIIVDVAAVANGTETGTQTVTATITDDDATPVGSPTVTLSIAPATLAEAAGTSTLTATLSAVSLLPVTVALTYAGTATTLVDYTGGAPVIVIPAGSLTGTLVLTAVQDVIDELDETIIVDVASVVNGTETGTQSVTATITDDDAAPVGSPTVTLSATPATLSEAAGTTTVTATLSAVSLLPVTVALTYSGTATNLVDYTGSVPVIVIPAGSLTGTVVLTAVQDLIDELDETITVDVANVVNGTETGTQQVNATIVDDDVTVIVTPTVTLSVAPATLAEAAGTSTVTATLSAVSLLPVTVNLTYTGSATTLVDYTGGLPAIVIPAGSLTGTVVLTAVQDVIDEIDETIIVDVASVVNGTETGTQQVTATINDDDPTPVGAPTVTLSVAPATMTEAAGTSTVTATLSAVSLLPVTVSLTYNGSATNVADYLRSGESIVIPAGSLTGSVILTAVQDAIDELDETIVVEVNTVANATESGTQQVTATITDDDTTPVGAPTVTLSVAPTVLGESAGTTTVTATLSAAALVPVTVALTYSGTATNQVDYNGSLPVIVIPAGSLTGTVVLTAIQDLTDEADETIIVDVASVANGTESGTQQVTATIIDDDGPVAGAPTLSISDLTVVEGDAGTTTAVFTVTMSAVSLVPVTVVATSADGSANSPTDFVALAPTTLTFAPGQTTQTVSVVINGDTLIELNENFFINLTAPIGATVADAQGVGTITNDETVPTLSISDVTVAEGNSGTTNAVFTVTLSAASSLPVTVVANTVDGTATTPSDYLALPSTTLTFAPGETSKTVTVAVNGDMLIETTETFVVNLITPVNATLADNQGVGTITDDDTASTLSSLSISDVTVVEGDSGTTNAVFTVTLSAASTQPVTVVATSGDGTATSPTDYIAIPATTITFAPGETSKTISVPVNGDTLVEANETFVVNLTAPVNATLSDNQGFGTITNDDLTSNVPSLSISDVTVTEGNVGTTNAVFTVTLSAASAQSVVVVIATSADGTANTPTDYIALAPTTLTFAPGETSKTVTVAVNGDTLAEGKETFVVNLNSPVNATLADNQGLGTITDDDTPANPSFISISDVTVNEGDFGTTNALFTITLSAASTQTVTVLATTGDGSASAPSDYLSILPTTVTFAPGETTKTISVAVNGDTFVENNESFVVNLSSAVNATLADNQGVGTIIDNDTGSIGGGDPTIEILNSDVTYQQGQKPIFLASGSTFDYETDENPNYANAKLTVSIVEGRSQGDRLDIFKKGPGANQIDMRGKKVLFEGVQIGTLTKGTNRHPNLVVTFNSNATAAAVSALLQSITFKTSGKVTTSERLVEISVTNIEGVDSDIGEVLVTVQPRFRKGSTFFNSTPATEVQ